MTTNNNINDDRNDASHIVTEANACWRAQIPRFLDLFLYLTIKTPSYNPPFYKRVII